MIVLLALGLGPSWSRNGERFLDMSRNTYTFDRFFAFALLEKGFRG
jgi:hypothetical protein